MQYGDIKKLKVSNKVVVELDANDIKYLNEHGTINWIEGDQVLGKLEDFQPAEEKIKFSEAEKKEFDKLLLGNDDIDFYDLMDIVKICDDIYFNLHERLFSGSAEKDKKSQTEFVKALENPDLIKIEVEKAKKYKIKLLNGYLYNIVHNSYGIADRKETGDIFTQSEIDELQKLDDFIGIDLNKCKEGIQE